VNLDINVGYFALMVARQPELLRQAEAMGYRCIWTAEAYGADAATPLAAIAAHTTTLEIGSGILQMPARTPAMTAMTAATLDDLTGGRFRLGLGLSGPQVVEGWHGVPYGKPLARTREYVSIVRKILAREEPVIHDGVEYQIPYRGEGATGLGKPLKLIGSAHPNIPIYLAAIGPKNVALTAEIADGWLPIFWSPERAPDAYREPLGRGFAASGEAGKEDGFDIVPTVTVIVTDDLEAARAQIRPQLALYIGGMGAKGRNFYNDLTVRYGFEEAAETIQDRYLAGDKDGAAAAVPDELVDEVALIGPKERIAERLERWTNSSVSTIAVAAMDPMAYQVMAELVL
jgi:F420-dependent oxidoreductase-like protein